MPFQSFFPPTCYLAIFLPKQSSIYTPASTSTTSITITLTAAREGVHKLRGGGTRNPILKKIPSSLLFLKWLLFLRKLYLLFVLFVVVEIDVVIDVVVVFVVIVVVDEVFVVVVDEVVIEVAVGSFF